MGKINAVITGVGGYVPDYILNNEELSRMVDTTDEWRAPHPYRGRPRNQLSGA